MGRRWWLQRPNSSRISHTTNFIAHHNVNTNIKSKYYTQARRRDKANSSPRPTTLCLSFLSSSSLEVSKLIISGSVVSFKEPPSSLPTCTCRTCSISQTHPREFSPPAFGQISTMNVFIPSTHMMKSQAKGYHLSFHRDSWSTVLQIVFQISRCRQIRVNSLFTILPATENFRYDSVLVHWMHIEL